MAKTFKNLPLSEVVVTSKPASECDFFDLTDNSLTADDAEVVPDVSNSGNSSLQEITDNLNNISNTNTINNIRTQNKLSSTTNGGPNNIRNLGNTDNPNNINTTPLKILANTEGPLAGRDARQTFVLSRNHLEQLRDYVHARRAGGDYAYSQKQAMQEALDLLFASTDPVAPRPDQAREREQQRRERIQQGRQSRA